jgi:multidrug resistance protein MdtO
MDGRASTEVDDLTTAYRQLEQVVWKVAPKQEDLTPQMQSFLLLSRRIAALADCLKTEM